MSNTNSVAGFAQSGTLRNQWPTQTIAATTETAFLLNTDTGTTTAFIVVPSGGSIYGAQQKLDVNANAAIITRSGREYGLPSGETNDQFSSSSWDGRPFKVRLSGIGTANHNAAQTITVNLYQGTSTTLASDKLLGSTDVSTTKFAVAQGATNVSFNFLIEATLLWDATSQVLSGEFTSNVAGGTTSQINAGTVVSNVVASVTTSGLSFLGSFAFGNAAGGSVTLREFIVDKL